MMVIDVQTQTEYRDSETQTSVFDLAVPEPWQTVRPDPWILEGCPVGFRNRNDVKCSLETQKEAPNLLFARGKQKASFPDVPMVIPRRNKEHDTFDSNFLEENRLVLEAFTSLSLDDLRNLEPHLVSKKTFEALQYSTRSVVSDNNSAGSRWLSKVVQGLREQNDSQGTQPSTVLEQSQSSLPMQSNQRHYAAYVGRRRRIITPRCDSSVVPRMERTNAVVLLQRCLRGRAAQISMAQARLRCLELYQELNELDDGPTDTTEIVEGTEGMLGVKVLVGERLSELLASFLAPST